MFEIKYEIFQDDLAELGTIDIQTFQKEFNQIYGCLTLVINGKEYLYYPSPEMRLETKRIFSELILTHFEFLIKAYNNLEFGDYVAIKYIENPWTWLEFNREGDYLIINDYHCEEITQQALLTNRELLAKADKKNLIDEKITWSEFEKELVHQSKKLLHTIETLNLRLIQAYCFNTIKEFSNRFS